MAAGSGNQEIRAETRGSGKQSAGFKYWLIARDGFFVGVGLMCTCRQSLAKSDT